MVTTRATTATICNGWVHCRYKFLLRLIMEDKYVFKSQLLQMTKRWQQCGGISQATPYNL